MFLDKFSLYQETIIFQHCLMRAMHLRRRMSKWTNIH